MNNFIYVAIVFVTLSSLFSINSLSAQLVSVPLSLCTLEGSPSSRTPDELQETLTNRIELATETILKPQQVQINFTVPSSDVPVLTDSDTRNGGIGDVVEHDNITTMESQALVNQCIQAWENLAGIAESEIGIMVINIDRFTYMNGTENDLLGASACDKNDPESRDCLGGDDWRSSVIIIDDCYTAIDKTCGEEGWNNDEFDQNMAHELGHALGLVHLVNGTALMNERPAVDSRGLVSNFNLSQTEIDSMERNARLVPNSEISPINSTSSS